MGIGILHALKIIFSPSANNEEDYQERLLAITTQHASYLQKELSESFQERRAVLARLERVLTGYEAVLNEKIHLKDTIRLKEADDLLLTIELAIEEPPENVVQYLKNELTFFRAKSNFPPH